MPRLFGTDGIRGIANIELKPTTAYALGRATAHRLAGGRGAIVVGQDIWKLELLTPESVCAIEILPREQSVFLDKKVGDAHWLEQVVLP